MALLVALLVVTSPKPGRICGGIAEAEMYELDLRCNWYCLLQAPLLFLIQIFCHILIYFPTLSMHWWSSKHKMVMLVRQSILQSSHKLPNRSHQDPPTVHTTNMHTCWCHLLNPGCLCPHFAIWGEESLRTSLETQIPYEIKDLRGNYFISPQIPF